MELQLMRLQQYRKENPNELTKEQFAKIESEILYSRDSKVISDEYFDFLLWLGERPSRQEEFANYLTRRLQRKDAKNILEVGSGRTCKLSRILEQKGFSMTCIDPKIDIQLVKEKAPEINLHQEKFDLNYDLTDFDFIIAQEPCDATEHVVRACVNQNKHFIMTLCGVPHTLISGESLQDVRAWHNYLANISDDIKLRRVALDALSTSTILLRY